jgi:hypothetical protein
MSNLFELKDLIFNLSQLEKSSYSKLIFSSSWLSEDKGKFDEGFYVEFMGFFVDVVFY